MSKEDLMMAHDNLNRELAEYKRLVSRDKHELIKSNINHIKRIKKLEDQNKHYREAIEKFFQLEGSHAEIVQQAENIFSRL